MRQLGASDEVCPSSGPLVSYRGISHHKLCACPERAAGAIAEFS
jgi:hypothetical protein